VGLKLNEILELLVYADVINLLGNNIGIIKKNMETFIEASMEVAEEKIKYIYTSKYN
jgi:hypothetical protein